MVCHGRWRPAWSRVPWAADLGRPASPALSSSNEARSTSLGNTAFGDSHSELDRNLGATEDPRPHFIREETEAREGTCLPLNDSLGARQLELEQRSSPRQRELLGSHPAPSLKCGRCTHGQGEHAVDPQRSPRYVQRI